jgi:hypothetical protein
MINVKDLRSLVIRPTLEFLGLYTPAAENLLVGTALHESHLTYLQQIGGGPAMGIYQIEPASHRDLFKTYLNYRLPLRRQIVSLRSLEPEPDRQLATNLHYSTAIARSLYYRRPQALPGERDIEGLAAYWKLHFNTPLGAGDPADWVRTYKEYGNA